VILPEVVLANVTLEFWNLYPHGCDYEKYCILGLELCISGRFNASVENIASILRDKTWTTLLPASAGFLRILISTLNTNVWFSLNYTKLQPRMPNS
jgi:hypothetical protein